MHSSFSRSNHTNWNHNQLYLSAKKKSVTTIKEQLNSTVAALGIGSCLLMGCYLFLSQLAQYGW